MPNGRKQPPNIPTEEEFARASAKMAAQNRMFANIRDHVLQLFSGRAPLHEIFLFPGPETDYEAYVFYNYEHDIETCRANGIEQLLKDAIAQTFAATGKSGDSETAPTLKFIFDSHENVKKRCNGNYYKYLK